MSRRLDQLEAENAKLKAQTQKKKKNLSPKEEVSSLRIT